MFQVHEPSIGVNTLAPVTVRPLLMATKGFPLEGDSEGPHCVPAGEMIKEFRGNNCSGILYLMSRSYQEKYSLFFFKGGKFFHLVCSKNKGPCSSIWEVFKTFLPAGSVLEIGGAPRTSCPRCEHPAVGELNHHLVHRSSKCVPDCSSSGVLRNSAPVGLGCGGAWL